MVSDQYFVRGRVIMSVYRRGKMWIAKANIQGKQHHVGTYATQREAKAAERDFLTERSRWASRETLTVLELWEKWLAGCTYRCRASTVKTYRTSTTEFVREYETRLITSITKSEALDWATTRPSSQSALRSLFAEAVKRDWLLMNPFANLGLKQSRGRKDITVIEPEELFRLIRAGYEVHGAHYGAELEAMIKIAAFSGLRRGEVAALTWADLDFVNDEITVSKTLSNDKDIELPKNGKIRTVVMAKEAKEALLAAPRHPGRDLVFCTPSGVLLSRSNFHYLWNPVRVTAGMPNFVFHELRHHCATYLIQTLNLSPLDTARQLGHSDGGKLVTDRYLHLDDTKQLERIKQAFGTITNTPSNVVTFRTRPLPEEKGASHV